MQIKGLHNCIYTLSHRALRQERIDKYQLKYGEPVKKWERLKREGVSDEVAHSFSGISRATYYRYRKVLRNLDKGLFPVSKAPKHKRQSGISQTTRDLILKIRQENPTYGKAKISVIIKRDHGQKLSESSVGRVLTEWLKKGKIALSRSALRPKRKRVFTKHAKAWQYGMKAHAPGEMVQVDHMTVSKNGKSVKHFQA